jgi:large subunit ribosomal protein L21
MRYAIIESGGKQYRAEEGVTIAVDRLGLQAGKKFDLEHVLLMADGDDIMVGTPNLSGINVKATVVEHMRGPKLISFRYSPKKRIRVKGGHRQAYTRLMIDFIGRPGEERKVEPTEVKKSPKKEPAKGDQAKKEAKVKSKAVKKSVNKDNKKSKKD